MALFNAAQCVYHVRAQTEPNVRWDVGSLGCVSPSLASLPEETHYSCVLIFV